MLPEERIKELMNSNLYMRWEKAHEKHREYYREFALTTRDKRSDDELIQEVRELSAAMQEDLVKKSGIPLIDFQKMRVLEIGGISIVDEALFEVKTRQKLSLDPMILRKVSNDCERIQAIGEFIPLKSDSIDVCFNRNTIDHVCDPLAVLKETLRILTKDGILILGCNVFNSWMRPLFPLMDKLEAPHPQHFTKSSLVRLMRKAGFECEVSDTERLPLMSCKALLGVMCGVKTITIKCIPKK
jgi:SAM-dependent methyltransferase